MLPNRSGTLSVIQLVTTTLQYRQFPAGQMIHNTTNLLPTFRQRIIHKTWKQVPLWGNCFANYQALCNYCARCFLGLCSRNIGWNSISCLFWRIDDISADRWQMLFETKLYQPFTLPPLKLKSADNNIRQLKDNFTVWSIIIKWREKCDKVQLHSFYTFMRN